MQSKSSISALLLSNADNKLYLYQNGVDMPIFTSEMKTTSSTKLVVAKKVHPNVITIFESVENETDNDEGMREFNDVANHTPQIPEIVEKHVREYITQFLELFFFLRI